MSDADILALIRRVAPRTSGRPGCRITAAFVAPEKTHLVGAYLVSHFLLIGGELIRRSWQLFAKRLRLWRNMSAGALPRSPHLSWSPTRPEGSFPSLIVTTLYGARLHRIRCTGRREYCPAAHVWARAYLPDHRSTLSRRPKPPSRPSTSATWIKDEWCHLIPNAVFTIWLKRAPADISCHSPWPFFLV